MLRLRVTSALSLLTLVVSIVGTSWLSLLTEVWTGPPQRYLAHAQASANAVPRRAHPSTRVALTIHRPTYRSVHDEPIASTAALVPTLVPVATPSDHSQSWDALRGHLDGRVVMHVDIDGGGRVVGARVSQSSGDLVLDAHALRSVRGWRFAVPADYPDGFAGELPMRFSSRGDGVARLP